LKYKIFIQNSRLMGVSFLAVGWINLFTVDSIHERCMAFSVVAAYSVNVAGSEVY
jgi:hypothetical protein